MKSVWTIPALVCALSLTAPLAVAEPPHARGHGLPPGLAKQGKLPPGWEKRLHPGAVLDDAIYEHVHHVPPHRTRYEEPDGIITVTIGGKLVRLIKETHEVVEILHE